MSKFDIDKEIKKGKRQIMYAEALNGLILSAFFICAFAIAASLFL